MWRCLFGLRLTIFFFIFSLLIVLPQTSFSTVPINPSSDELDAPNNLTTVSAVAAAGGAAGGAAAAAAFYFSKGRDIKKSINKKENYLEQEREDIRSLKEQIMRKNLQQVETDKIYSPQEERKRIYELLFRQLPMFTTYQDLPADSLRQLLETLTKWYFRDSGGLTMSNNSHLYFKKLERVLNDELQSQKRPDELKAEKGKIHGHMRTNIVERYISDFIISLRKDLELETK